MASTSGLDLELDAPAETRLPDPTTAYEVKEKDGSLAQQLGVRILPRPGTAFRYRKRYVYFATELQTVLEIDELAFLAITALLTGRTDQDAWDMAKRRGLITTPGQIKALLTGYRDAGLFAVAPQKRIRETMDATIDALLRHQPMKMMLFMAQSCNLRCTYCYGVDANYEDLGEHMTPELCRQSVDYLFDNSPGRPHFYIYFFGGEPLLNQEGIRATVAYARERAKKAEKTVEFGITTNATMLTDKAIDLLIEEDFQICVSLDGSPEGHDANRITKGGSGSFKHALKGYRKLMKRSTRGNQVKVRATMSHQNHDPLEIAEYFESIGIYNYGIGSAFERAGSPGTPDVLPDDLREMEQSFETLLDRVLDRLEKGKPTPRYNPFFRTVGSMTSGSRQPFIGCGLCRNDQGVGTDGSIYPCHRYAGLDNYVIGNVETGVDKSKARAVYQQFFDLWDRHCRDCWARYTCSGACMWQYSHDDGMLRNPIDYQCENIRKSVHRSAWMVLELSQKYPKTFKNICRTEAASGGCCRPE